MSLVYFGASTDFEPVVDETDIKTFYYVDALPNTKHYEGSKGEWIDNHFVEAIDYALNELGWQCVEKSENYLLYHKEDKQFHYYMNRNVDTDAETTQFSKDLLKSCSHAFIRGYVPAFIDDDMAGDCLIDKVVYISDFLEENDYANLVETKECILVTDDAYEHPFNRELWVHFIRSKGYPEWML